MIATYRIAAVNQDIVNAGQTTLNALNAYPTYYQTAVDWAIQGAFVFAGMIGAVMLIRHAIGANSN